MSEDAGKQLVEGDVTITAILSDKRQVNVRVHLYVGEDQHMRNARVDAVQDIVDRQLIRSDLVAKTAEVAQWEASAIGLREHFSGVLTKQQSGQRLVTAEKELLASYEGKMASIKERIDGFNAAIAEGKQKLNGATRQ